MNNLIKYLFVATAIIGSTVGCGKTDSTTTTTEYPATVSKPATVTDTRTIEVHEDKNK